MKSITTILSAVLLLTFTACEKKPQTLGEKIENKTNDALDRRPGEKVRDAAEDVKAEAKEAKEDIKDAVKK